MSVQRMRRLGRPWWLSAATVLASALLASSARGSAPPYACWKELAFGAGNSLASATSTLHFRSVSHAEASARLVAPEGIAAIAPPAEESGLVRTTFTAMRSHGELLTWYDPKTLQVLQSTRTGHGQQSRRKTHRFLADGVWRERREPVAGNDAEGSKHWRISSSGVQPYPASALPLEGPVLTPVMLLARASALSSRTVAGAPATESHLVYTDSMLFRVTLTGEAIESLEGETTLEAGTGAARTLPGPRRARKFTVSAQPLGDATSDETFSLLELDGDLSIFIDMETGLPLRVQGTWLHFGVIPVTLVRARLAPSCVQ